MTELLRPEMPTRTTTEENAADSKHNGDCVTTSLDELRRALMMDLSHQLRTPVTAMRLALDGMLSDIDTDERNGELINVTRRNLDRIVGIVNRQLELLGVTLGEASVHREHVAIADVLERVLTALSSAGATVDIVIEATGTATAYTDPDRLESLLTGLLADGPRGATRRINVRPSSSECIIEVYIDYLRGESAPSVSQSPVDGAMDFEQRACRATINALGGDIEMRKTPDMKQVRITLPVIGE